MANVGSFLMQVCVYQNNIAIGTAVLEHLDPPMGVAYGPFLPSDHYDRGQHANTVEGDYIDDRGRSLSVCAEQYGPIKTASIAIEDWTDPEIGRHLTIWFQDRSEFEAFFSTHEDYKVYYAR